MEIIKILYESLGVGLEVAFQKLWMWNVPSLDLVGGPAEGLTCVVTGPTSGIGREAATELARRGARVILACRSVERGQALQQEIVRKVAHGGCSNPQVDFMELDLSSLSSVRAFAQNWTSQTPLHVLINNAGIFSMSAPRSETPDGFEMHIGTNYLGHFLLTLLLLPAMRAGAAMLGRPARVVNVSSRLHLMGSMHRDDPHLIQRYTSLTAYAQSKLMQISFAGELTRRASSDVHAVALHPGEVVTDVVRSLPGPMQKLYKLLLGVILINPAQGARCSVYCATSPKLDTPGMAGAIYFDSNCRPGRAAPLTNDREAAEWLWDWSAKAVGLSPNENLEPASDKDKEL